MDTARYTQDTQDKQADTSASTQQIVPKIVFCGLPSAGKSSIINSLVGKRILDTGVCRTTKDAYYIGVSNDMDFPPDKYHAQDPVSDDGIRFSIIDLPGVADSENKESSNDAEDFDSMTLKYAAKCDVICWVTDIRTAFLTSHEKAEYDKIRSVLSKISLESGKLYQMFVVLAKYDMDDRGSTTRADGFSGLKEIESDGEIESDEEISDKEEDTTVRNCYDRVARLFNSNGVRLVKFNAFGRIMHSDMSSPRLKSLVQNIMP